MTAKRVVIEQKSLKGDGEFVDVLRFTLVT
jgi:hypothetical protein